MSGDAQNVCAITIVGTVLKQFVTRKFVISHVHKDQITIRKRLERANTQNIDFVIFGMEI